MEITSIIAILLSTIVFILIYMRRAAKDLVRERRHLKQIEEQETAINDMEYKISEAKTELAYLQNRCHALTHGTMCEWCEIDCIYKKK